MIYLRDTMQAQVDEITGQWVFPVAAPAEWFVTRWGVCVSPLFQSKAAAKFWLRCFIGPEWSNEYQVLSFPAIRRGWNMDTGRWQNG